MNRQNVCYGLFLRKEISKKPLVSVRIYNLPRRKLATIPVFLEHFSRPRVASRERKNTGDKNVSRRSPEWQQAAARASSTQAPSTP